MTMKLKPLADRVLVEPIEEEETRASGIILVDTAKDKPTRGKVLAVGDGIQYEGGKILLTVKAGDTVVYSRYGGTEVTHDGKECLMMREADILAVVEDES